MTVANSTWDGSQRNTKTALLWICIVAPVAGFADSIISLLRSPLPYEYDEAAALFAPLAATTAAAALLFAALWGMLLTFSRTGSRFPVLPNLVAASITIVTFLALALLTGAVLPTRLEQDAATGLFKLGVTGAVAMLLLRGGYLIGVDVAGRIHTKRSPILLCLALPYLCAWTLTLVWISRYRLEAALLSRDGLTVLTLFGLGALATIAIFFLAGHLRALRIAAALPLCAILILAAASPFFSSSPTVSPVEGAPRAGAVFLITIDSLRADVLSCYGSERVITANIDGLAEDSVVFSNAISPSSWTLPAVASFMTGVSPAVHGATTRDGRLADRFKTIAEYFKEAGYRTVAVGQNPALDRSRNLHQGFDEYTWISAYERSPVVSLGRVLLNQILPRKTTTFSEEITDRAIARLGLVSQGPVFYWIHYYDPHLPYSPPERFVEEAVWNSPFGKEFNSLDSVRAGRFGTDRAQQDWIRKLYEGEVRHVDDELGRLLEAIKARKLYDGSTIILSSDHGEEFWDHGGFEHGHTMYQELLRVPLMIKRATASSTGRVEATVGTESLAPTLLDLAGIAFDSGSMNSPSLLPLINQESTEPITVTSFGTLYFEQLQAVTAPNYKFIRAIETEASKLFDRLRDPLEQAPLSLPDNAATVDAARQRLEQAHGPIVSTDDEPAIMDAQSEDSLRALGYID